MVEDFAKLDMLLKVKRGNKEEKVKVEVEVHHKSDEGTYHLNHMEPDHS